MCCGFNNKSKFITCTKKTAFFSGCFNFRWLSMRFIIFCLSCSSSQDMLHAASVTGVTYSITDTQSSHKCPCKQVQRSTESNHYTIYVSYSAVNISVVARNAAGVSPAAVASVGQMSTAGLKREYTLEIACVPPAESWTSLALASVLCHQLVTEHYWVRKWKRETASSCTSFRMEAGGRPKLAIQQRENTKKNVSCSVVFSRSSIHLD